MTDGRRGLLAVVVVMGLALVGCGGGSPDATGVASLQGEGAAGAADDDGGSGGDGDEATQEEIDDAMLAFAACMREHGIDMPDPTSTGSASSGGGTMIRIDGGGEGPDGATRIDSDAFQEAHETCKSIMEDVVGEPEPMDPEEEAKMRDQMLEFAQCMRDHGVDMPDPEFSGDGGVSISIGSKLDGDTATPADQEEMEAAQEACGEIMGGDGPGFSIGRAPIQP